MVNTTASRQLSYLAGLKFEMKKKKMKKGIS